MSEPLPQQCQECPMLAKVDERIDALGEVTSELLHTAFEASIDNEDFIDHYRILEASDQLQTDDAGQPMSLEGYLEWFKQNAGAAYDILDETRGVGSERLVADIVENCQGPLRMRARAKSGRLVMVTVCDSPYAPVGTTDDEPVFISRS